MSCSLILLNIYIIHTLPPKAFTRIIIIQLNQCVPQNFNRVQRNFMGSIFYLVPA
jgi:hypothetical protein